MLQCSAYISVEKVVGGAGGTATGAIKTGHAFKAAYRYIRYRRGMDLPEQQRGNNEKNAPTIFAYGRADAHLLKTLFHFGFHHDNQGPNSDGYADATAGRNTGNEREDGCGHGQSVAL